MMFVASVDTQGRYGMCSAARAHRPAVVVAEGGLAAPVEVWRPLLERLADDVDAVATERNGVFRSTRARGTRCLARLADETAASVEERAAGRRVVMIAEGFGGLVALETASRHRGLIDALILVDALHPEALARSARQRQAMARLEATMIRSALRDRIRRDDDATAFPLLSPDQGASASRALRAAPWTHSTALRELQQWKRDRPRPTAPRLGALRLSVLSSEEFYRGDPSQAPLQHALADLSDVSSLRRIPGASALTDPAAIDAVAEVALREARALEESLVGKERAS